MKRIPVIKVSSAIPGTKIEHLEIDNEPGIKLVESDEYIYLSAFPLCSDGTYIPVCSKDMKEWSVCFGAKLDGEEITNVLEIALQIQKYMEAKNE